MLTTTEMKTIASLFAKMDSKQASEIAKMFNDSQKIRQRQEASQFSVNDTVTFTDRLGRRITGTVEKVNRKTIKVSTSIGRYSVSPSLLTKGNK